MQRVGISMKNYTNVKLGQTSGETHTREDVIVFAILKYKCSLQLKPSFVRNKVEVHGKTLSSIPLVNWEVL